MLVATMLRFLISVRSKGLSQGHNFVFDLSGGARSNDNSICCVGGFGGVERRVRNLIYSCGIRKKHIKTAFVFNL